MCKQPLFKILTLTLRNISQYSRKLPSSAYSTVLIAQDMKFGCEFIIKIYRKRDKERQYSLTHIESGDIDSKVSKVKNIKSLGSNIKRANSNIE